MATVQEIHRVLSGFPHNLTWGNFKAVATSPSPPHQAQTASSFSMGSWRAALEHGAYRVRGFHINVFFNPGTSWVTAAGRANQGLLRHEQGHLDITGLVASDLAGKLLDLSLDASVVAAQKGAGNTSVQHLRFAQQQLQRSVDQFGAEARALLAKLQTNPTTGADGIYDKQTQHGQNANAQATWDARFAHAKRGTENFGLSLAMAGLV